MSTLRSFPYDHPNYTLVRTHAATHAATASNVSFAKFRSRVATVINQLTIAVASVASAAKVVFTIYRNSSLMNTYTLASATTLGNVTAVSLDVTLLSAGDFIGIRSDDGAKGDFQVIYEYQVLPNQSLYTRA